MTRRLIWLSTFAVLAASAAPAHASDSLGVLVPQIMVTSDYRFDGVSSSALRPAVQGSLYWWRPDKTYAGVFVTQVNFRDPGKTSYEVDYYAGHHFDVKGAEVTGEAMYTAYPDNRTWGPTYDFLQLKAKAERKFEKLTLGGDLAWTPQSPYHTGVAWRVEGTAAYALTPNLTLEGKLGHRWIQVGYDRTFWELGGMYSRKAAAFELRYVGTDLHRSQCGYLRNDWCAPAVVGTLTVNMPYLRLGR